MKTRNDFVSNSSSCSFIIIAESGTVCDTSKVREPNDNPWLYSVPNKKLGCVKFGWQNEMYSSFEDKLNWCGIILLDMYAACRNAELRAAWTDKTAAELDDKYEETLERFMKWKALLEKVCTEKFGVGIRLDLDWLKLYGGTEESCKQAFVSAFDCFIDHQSGVFEKPANGRMFESEDVLFRFLAYDGSYIQCGNDNEF